MRNSYLLTILEIIDANPITEYLCSGSPLHRENGGENIPVGENTGKLQGILFAKVVNSLVIKVKYIAKLAAIILMRTLNRRI